MVTARMQFMKGDNVRYISHLDLQQTFQRALRRGEIDVAYSQGFNPHPRISFAMALSVGMTSQGEYVDVELNHEMDPKDLVKKLNEVLPPQLKILECKTSDKPHASLMSVIKKGVYDIRLYGQGFPEESTLLEKIKGFMDLPEILVEKVSKKGKRTLRNIRPLIDYIHVKKEGDDSLYFEIMVATGSENNLKPEIVIEQLDKFGHSFLQYDRMKVHRRDLLAKEGDKIVRPIDLF